MTNNFISKVLKLKKITEFDENFLYRFNFLVQKLKEDNLIPEKFNFDNYYLPIFFEKFNIKDIFLKFYWFIYIDQDKQTYSKFWIKKIFNQMKNIKSDFEYYNIIKFTEEDDYFISVNEPIKNLFNTFSISDRLNNTPEYLIVVFEKELKYFDFELFEIPIKNIIHLNTKLDYYNNPQNIIIKDKYLNKTEVIIDKKKYIVHNKINTNKYKIFNGINNDLKISLTTNLNNLGYNDIMKLTSYNPKIDYNDITKEFIFSRSEYDPFNK